MLYGQVLGASSGTVFVLISWFNQVHLSPLVGFFLSLNTGSSSAQRHDTFGFQMLNSHCQCLFTISVVVIQNKLLLLSQASQLNDWLNHFPMVIVVCMHIILWSMILYLSIDSILYMWTSGILCVNVFFVHFVCFQYCVCVCVYREMTAFVSLSCHVCSNTLFPCHMQLGRHSSVYTGDDQAADWFQHIYVRQEMIVD